MKRFLSHLFILAIGVSVLSCSKEGVPSTSSGILGTWNATLFIGQDDLTDILSVKIEKSTITMSFKRGGHYGFLYEEYGPSNSVHYTYNANDVDLDGQKCISLTFDKPLYFIEYSTENDYISKVIIDVDGNEFIDADRNKIIWSDYEQTHGLILSK